MDNETLRGIVGYSSLGAMVGGAITLMLCETINKACAKRKAPILDRDYGPKIAGNFIRLESAVRAGDRQEALVAVAERRTMLRELDTISFYYRGKYASEKVKDDIARGASLEAYLTRVPPGDCCIP